MSKYFLDGIKSSIRSFVIYMYMVMPLEMCMTCDNRTFMNTICVPLNCKYGGRLIIFYTKKLNV